MRLLSTGWRQIRSEEPVQELAAVRSGIARLVEPTGYTVAWHANSRLPGVTQYGPKIVTLDYGPVAGYDGAIPDAATDEVTGTALHELGHIMAYRQDDLSRARHPSPYWSTIRNVLEDLWIERAAYRRRPAYSAYMAVLRNRIRPESQQALDATWRSERRLSPDVMIGVWVALQLDGASLPDVAYRRDAEAGIAASLIAIGERAVVEWRTASRRTPLVHEALALLLGPQPNDESSEPNDESPAEEPDESPDAGSGPGPDEPEAGQRLAQRATGCASSEKVELASLGAAAEELATRADEESLAASLPACRKKLTSQPGRPGPAPAVSASMVTAVERQLRLRRDPTCILAGHQPTGRVDRRALYRAGYADDVLAIPVDDVPQATTVVLMLDGSGSVGCSGWRDLVAPAGEAIRRALARLDDVSCWVYAYSSNLVRVARPGQSSRWVGSFQGGGTASGRALEAILAEVHPTSQHRLIIHVTDGRPDSRYDWALARSRAARQGWALIGILVERAASGLHLREQHAPTLDDLPDALGRVLQAELQAGQSVGSVRQQEGVI